MEAPKKTGFWTQHVDPKSGRTYYFNMALGRSYWELPPELQAQVKKPALDALREWDPEAAERKYGAANQQAGGGNEELRRKREEALTKSRTEAAEAQAASTKLSLEERMALAAQKRKAAEVQQSGVAGSRLPSSSSNEYLELVRQLQQNDDSEEGAGGKWLVR
ncbi:peroxisomal targeting signal 2 receptor [Phytophthora pseudosyringae]|uniref:Peroxisomal targeting signal 2 receptor n=1 Tax=Phytophthora pseudosyringae TaxID=221518 RepID=A0A8T1WDD6_9STRA|nr:peroxisomal targeting signal 2 receptor [Phytophthora pseudosyringae]